MLRAVTSVTFLGAMLSLAPVAGAQTACGDLPSQSAMRICFGDAAIRSDVRLDSLIQALGRALKPQHFTALQKVQATWRAFRRADCRWAFDALNGGTFGPTASSICWLDHTNARIKQLAVYLCDDSGMVVDCPARRRYEADSTGVERN